MAKQTGLLRVKGTLDNVTFYKGKGAKNKTENLAKMKGGVDGDVIKNSPSFSRTRENMNEFAIAGTWAKEVYNAFEAVTSGARDRQAISRITTAFRANLTKDGANARGSRQVQFDDLSELDKYEFNQGRKFSASYNGKLTAAKGATDVTVDVAAIVPMYDIKNKQGCTHAKVTIAVLTIKADGTSELQTQATDYIDVVSPDEVAASTLTFVDAAVDAETIMICAAIKGYQLVNTVYNQLNNMGFNASTLLPTLV